MKNSVVGAALLACIIASPAAAQVRATVPQMQSRDFEAAKPDPAIVRLSELQQEVAALKESAGKQVIVLHYSPTEHPGSLENNFNANQAFATQACEQMLGDRFGRMIAYRVWANGDRYFLTHISCETKL